MFTFKFKFAKLKTMVHVVILAAVMFNQTTQSIAEIKTTGDRPHTSEEKAVITPEVQFQNELNRLASSFSMDVDGIDTVTMLEESINSGVFSGLKSWAYEGVKNGDKITLRWTAEWFDEHAVLMAYKNQTLSEKLTKKQLTLLSKCKEIINSKITLGMTDYEKQLAIHDYIALNCTFDSDLEKSQNATGEEDSFFAYGALVNGKAVCAGYTEAAKLLLDMVGIENYRLDSMEHSWNLVKIDGGYYHMDISWDDPVPDVPGYVSYDYFNLSDTQISGYKNHNWLNKDIYPKANAKKYNYYVYNNLEADDFQDVQRILSKAAAEGNELVTIFVSGDFSDGFNWHESLKFINGLPFKESKITKYSYSPPNENKHTLTVVFNK